MLRDWFSLHVTKKDLREALSCEFKNSYEFREEIKEGTWRDTFMREVICDIIMHRYLKLTWPRGGYTIKAKQKFFTKLYAVAKKRHWKVFFGDNDWRN